MKQTNKPYGGTQGGGGGGERNLIYVGPGRRVAEHRPGLIHHENAGVPAGLVVQLAGEARPPEAEGQAPGPPPALRRAPARAPGAEADVGVSAQAAVPVNQRRQVQDQAQAGGRALAQAQEKKKNDGRRCQGHVIITATRGHPGLHGNVSRSLARSLRVQNGVEVCMQEDRIQ